MNKKFGCLFLAVCLCVSLAAPSFAAAADDSGRAEILRDLGLFLGSDDGFELDRPATRAEAAVMVVRMLGREATAKSENLSHPFSDVPEWASAYVGYLYRTNITKGISEDMFGASDMATAAQYATYILRALGYNDAAGDFVWNRALDKMAELGIITNKEAAEFSGDGGVLRGAVVSISYLSLFASSKGSRTALLEKLYWDDKAISLDQMKAAVSADERIALLAGPHGVPRAYPGGGALDAEEIYKKASDAVFKITTYLTSDGEAGTGSGFFISPDGIAVTNEHVLAYAGSAEIMMPDGTTHPIESILGINKDEDLALIKVAGSDFPYLELGDPALLRTAQRIYCLGSPLGFDNTISDGLVSNANREYEGKTYIQISAPIAPGSSGGALLNEYGQVVGVTTMGTSVGQINLAVPVTRLSTLFRFHEARSWKYMLAHANFGGLPISDAYIETESDEAQLLPPEAIAYGSISGSEDVDVYALEIPVTSDMLVSLTSDAAHSQLLRFEVQDPDGNTILSSAHYEGEVFSFAAGLAPVEGTYTLLIYPDGGDSWTNIGYELYWTSLPTFEESGDVLFMLEFEPNDDIEHANYLPDFADILAFSTSFEDLDYYRFTLAQDSDYYAFITENSFESIYKAEIIDAATLETVGIFESDGWGYLEFEDFLEAGDYYILVQPESDRTEWTGVSYYISGWFQ